MLRIRFVIPLIMAAILTTVSVAVSLATSARAHHAVPSTSNIEVREGVQPGEVIISWEGVPEATHYRIGYVNMEVDYYLAKASCIEEWIEAFVYVDVNARNIPIRNGRAEYTVRRLSPGARHAFTVLTSNDFVDTGGGGSVSSEFYWSSNPRWQFLPGRNTLPPGMTLPSPECTEPAASQTDPPPTSNIAVRDGNNSGELTISWDAVSEATHYRIGYVNMEVDYHLAKASCTGEWIEAFVYVDVNARNIPINNGRAEYTVRRLSPGARHAVTVLTSNNFVDTGSGGSVSSEFFWPSNPRWQFVPGRNTLPPSVMLPTGECADVSQPTPSGSVEGDRSTLVFLYDATDGANWTNTGNWLSDSPVGQWHGVIAGEDGRVTGLNLKENGLSGSIPPQLADLSNLELLRLDDNQLTGRIPPQLGRLSNLERLLLDNNGLEGHIPAELAQLSNLEWLYLHNNELTGNIPPGLAQLSGLTRLLLAGNSLTGPVPAWLRNLTNLQELTLSRNQLTGEIPPELGNLTGLEVLWLDRNELTGQIPTELANLTNLRVLSLWKNNLSGPVPS